MKTSGRVFLVSLVSLIVGFLYLTSNKSNFSNYNEIQAGRLQQAKEAVLRLSDRFMPERNPNEVTFASTACTLKQFELVVTMVKSAVMLSGNDQEYPLEVVIFTVKELFSSFTDRFTTIQKSRSFSFVLREVNFPKNNYDDWRNFGSTEECTAQKIFLPSLLPEVNRLLYVSPESIFLAPPHETFMLLRHFKKGEMVGMAREEDNSVYNEKKGHPYYGTYGINSGILLMDLKKMRESDWEKDIQELFIENHKKASYGDQDLLNIYLNTRPNNVYEMPCDYNFRTEHCEAATECQPVEGIKIFHANRNAFLGAKNVVFKHIHGMIEKVRAGEGSLAPLVA
jgi:UDP-xylose:glucoside alpha-1,3-xylosyltransferase